MKLTALRMVSRDGGEVKELVAAEEGLLLLDGGGEDNFAGGCFDEREVF